MKISVVIPVYNERSTIMEIVRRVKSVNLDKEIIIVDDGSTDGTGELLRENFSGENEIRIIQLATNHGKGFAIREAVKHINGDVVILQDADLEYDPEEYKQLIAPIEKGDASVVYGSRFMKLNKFRYLCSWLGSKLRGKECSVGHLYFSNFMGIQVLNLLVRILYGTTITDEATCYKVFRAEIFKKADLRSTGFEFCPEITAKVCKLGYKIHEVTISYKPRGADEGKKIGWKDGLAAIAALLKYRFID